MSTFANGGVSRRAGIGLLTLVASTSAIVHAPAPAGAGEVATCLGESATIVGDPASVEVLYGTDGDDVIVTNGVHEVYALGGGDRVCVTRSGEDWTSRIYAGDGNDSVSVDPAERLASRTELGAGEDTFTSDRGEQLVYAGAYFHEWTQPPEAASDAERDEISTGGAQDIVFVGEVGEPTRDVVDTAAGRDEVTLLSFTAGDPGSIDLGTERNLVRVVWPEGTQTWTFDNAAEQLRVEDDVVAQVRGASKFYFDAGGLQRTLTFVGAEFREEVVLRDGAAVIKGRDGNDHLILLGCRDSRLRGGNGRDHLRSGDPECEQPGMRRVLVGGRGRDWIEGRERVDDVMIGGSGPDRMYGRGGWDEAYGGPGHDECAADVRVSCHPF